MLRAAIAELQLENFVVGSADLGRPQWVKSYAKHFGVPIVVVDKDRQFERTTVVNVVGDVKGKIVLIYDDMTRTAGTLVQAAAAYRQAGAADVIAVLSHCALANEDAVNRLEASAMSLIITTNAHPASWNRRVRESRKFHILDVTPIFGDAIGRILNLEKPCA